MVAVEPSLRFLMGRSSDHKVELIGGYTFLRMKDNLNIASTSRDLFTGNLIPDNTVFRTVDNFSATNTFHGGHIGLESKINRRRVSLGTLAKVSIGNFTQTTSTTGSTTIAPPPGTVPGAPFAGGLYTQQSNIHNFTREKFGFIPELGVNGGFNLNSNIQLTAGYSFLYLSNVALAGNQVDRNIDFTQAQGGPLGTQPSGAYRDGSTWYQGLNLGVNMTY
ncbi:MAG: BBP7 family outer membrane beta-barrel protein [Pirellulales bacterium]